MRNTFYVSKGDEKATCDFYCLSLAIKTFLRRVKRKVIFAYTLTNANHLNFKSYTFIYIF